MYGARRNENTVKIICATDDEGSGERYCRREYKSATDGAELTKLKATPSSQAVNVCSECELSIDEDLKYVAVMETVTSTLLRRMIRRFTFSSCKCVQRRRKSILSVLIFNLFEVMKLLTAAIHTQSQLKRWHHTCQLGHACKMSSA